MYKYINKYITKIGMCRLSFTWFIIATILTILTISACNPHSVRSGYYSQFDDSHSLKSGNHNQKEIEQGTYLEEEQPQAEVIKTKDISKSIPEEKTEAHTQSNTPRKIPTLREQMTAISNEQVSMNGRLTNIENDIKDIKSSIEDIKDGIRFLADKKVPEPVKGAEQKSEKSTRKNTLDKNDNIILSDEDLAQKSKEQKVQKTATKEAQPNEQLIKPKKAKKPQPKITKNENKKPAVSKTEKAAANNSQAEPKEYQLAMNDYSNRNYNEAINKFTKVVQTERNPVTINNCNYWLGESYYGLKQYSEAMNYFSRVLKSAQPAKKPESQLMIAEINIRTGKIPEAKKAFTNIIEKYPDCEFVPRAKKMLQQL